MMHVIVGIVVSLVATSLSSKFNEFSIVPVKYKIHYTFGNDQNLTTYNGSVSIEFKANTNLNTLDLDYFGNITVIKLRNLNSSSDIENFQYESVGELAQQQYRLEYSEVFIRKNECYEMFVNFIGTDYNYHIGLERTFFLSQNGVKSPIIYTDFTKQFNLIFPRFAKIMLNTKYELSVMHNKNLTCISNMRAFRIEISPLVATTKFDETPLIALHAFGFALGKFTSTIIKNQYNFPITIYSSQRSIESIDVFPEYVGQMFNAYKKYLKHELSVPKIDFVAIPDLTLVSITNYGLVICRDTIFNNPLASLKPTIIIPTAGKAIGDHFLIDLYGSIGSPFHWIKDGLSSYLTGKMLETIEPFTENLFKMISYHKSLEIEHNLDSIKLSDGNGRRDVRYTKSAALFQMIDHVMGESRFQTSLQNSLNHRKDFIQILAHNFGDEPKLNKFIDGWVNQRGYPIVMVERNYTSGEVSISQKAYGWSDMFDSDVKWWIPYNFASKSNPDFHETKPNGWLSERNATISLNVSPSEWIILNKRSVGYFLVNYDHQNWNLIIEELTNGNMDKIHPVNRDYLLTTAYLLMSSKEMPRTMFFSLLLYLKREIHPRPWFIANVILDEIVSRDLVKEHSVRFNQVIYSITDGLYNKYGEFSLYEEPFEITQIIAMKWACYAGHKKCLIDFELMSNFYVQLNEYNQSTFMNVEIRNLMFCYGFRNESNYVKLYSDYMTASYSEMIKNRIECHLHTDMFRSKFIADFIVRPVREMAVELILKLEFQDAIPKLIYDVFDFNFDEFRMEYDRTVRLENRLVPFETINGMIRHFERYVTSQEDGISREKMKNLVKKIRTTFGDEAAEMIAYDLELEI